MLDDDLNALIDGAYAMALEPALVEEWVRRISTTLGGVVGTLAVSSASGALLRIAIFHQLNQQLVDNYFDDGMLRYDPQVSYARTLGGTTVFLDTDHVDEDHPDTAEFMAYSRGTLGIDHHMTLHTPLSSSGYSVGLSINRRATDGHTPTLERERLTAIVPSLTRAFTLGLDHADKLQTAFWDGVMAARTEPAILLDEHGRAVRLTPAAADMLARSDALDVVGERLRCGEPAADDCLQRVVSAAICKTLPASGSVALPSRIGRRPLILSAFPLARSHRMLAPCEAAALVTIVDPAARRAGDVRRWETAFDLTPREAEFAATLAIGHSIESAAALLGISAGTARVHLRHVFAKTQTSRQADLIALLLRV